MRIGAGLDWLTVTLPYRGKNFQPDFYTFENYPQWDELRGIGSYTNTVRSEYLTVSWHMLNPSQKVMVQMTGENFERTRESDLSDKFVAEWYMSRYAHVTRVDVAFDFVDCSARVQDFSEAWKTDRLRVKAKKMTHINGQTETGDAGQTVYLGSRTSQRMVRVYDKAAQQGIDADWVRVELEWKAPRSQSLVKDIAQSGVVVAGLSHLRDFIPFTRIGWFEKLFNESEELLTVDKIARPKTDTNKWVRDVCLPAIARAIKSGDEGIRAAVQAILDETSRDSNHGASFMPRVPRK